MAIIGSFNVGETAMKRTGNQVTVLLQNVPMEAFSSGEPTPIVPGTSQFILFFFSTDPAKRPVPDTAVVTVDRVMEYTISGDAKMIETLKFVYTDQISSVENVLSVDPVATDAICYKSALLMMYAVPFDALNWFFDYIATKRSVISYCGTTYYFHTMGPNTSISYNLQNIGIADAGRLMHIQAVAYSTKRPASADDQEAIKEIFKAKYKL